MKEITQKLQIFQFVIIISGVSVPGKYLEGKPINFLELKRMKKYFPRSKLILLGPATIYGIGQEGGKPSISSENLNNVFHVIIKNNPESTLFSDFEKIFTRLTVQQSYPLILRNEQNSMAIIQNVALNGAKIVIQHPNHKKSTNKNKTTSGNLICEIETFRGCPRYKTGGCSFCIEPSKGKTKHRTIDSIIKEIKQLYHYGVRHFRLGNQADFYAFQHLNSEHNIYPKPNVEAIAELLKRIRKNCPEIKTLHIDNVNPLNFVHHNEEAKKITEIIVKYCTAGNIAALGVESLDPIVIKNNNLKITENELMHIIKQINNIGKEKGNNGVPKFLPGLNFIMGLVGETEKTLSINYQFLLRVLNKNLLLRRINLRKLIVSTNKNLNFSNNRKAHLQQFHSKYYHWRKKIRNDIDKPMLKKLFPFGSCLKEAYCEKHEGNNSLLRQIGTYPIICFVPKKLKKNKFYSLRVIEHGFRSLTCLPDPIILNDLQIKQLSAIPGIGNKRATKIIISKPKSNAEWEKLLGKKLWNKIKLLKPCIKTTNFP